MGDASMTEGEISEALQRATLKQSISYHLSVNKAEKRVTILLVYMDAS